MRKLGNGVPSLLLEAELECQLLRWSATPMEI